MMNGIAYPRVQRLMIVGAPLFTGFLLLFHPRVEPVDMEHADQLGGIDLYALVAPLADSFLAVHVLFALALALLGLSIIFLLQGIPGFVAALSRISAFLFTVTYIMYETIVGTATALLVRGASSLPPGEQAAIGDAVRRIYRDPLLGDVPSILASVAWLSWLLAVILAAVALRRSGKPLVPCVLLGLSFVFISHASLFGLLGMVFFFLAAVGITRAAAPALTDMDFEVRPSS